MAGTRMERAAIHYYKVQGRFDAEWVNYGIETK